MTDLEQAAYDFEEARRAVDSADEAGAPSEVLHSMRANAALCRLALMDACAKYFDNTHDGAPV